MLNGMTRQTLRDWVHHYNTEGVAGLRSRSGPGRPPLLTDVRMEELREIVLKGPDPRRHIVIRWRCADLCEEISARWSVKVCEQTMGRWLHRLEMTRLQPRPRHPKKDPEAEVTFKKQARSGGPPGAVENGLCHDHPEGSGRKVFGGYVPGKKRGP
jgi:transposase